MSGEVITRIVEVIGTSSIKSIKIHAIPYVPLPAAISLEEVAVPNVGSITQAIKDTLR